jgi:glucokinase
MFQQARHSVDPMSPQPTHSLPAPAPAPTSAPGPWLLADIGGTNARFGWLPTGQRQPLHIATLSAADHAGPTAAARSYLAALAATLGADYRPPRAAAFAVATAVTGDSISFTNSGWALSRQAAQQDLGLDDLRLLNDFEALALSLPRLTPEQWRPIGSGGPAPGRGDAALAVIGPGTGLGVAGLVPSVRGWVALPGEGGHATLSAGDDFEWAVLSAARQQHPHVSAERLLSGIGLPLLHQAVAAVLGHGKVAPLTSEQVVERALKQQDAACERSIDTFCAMLGSFAGNVALTLGARGGVYIGGGIVPRLGERFFASSFRERFESKGRFQAYLQAVPTLLITDTLAALTGAAVALEQPAP